MSLDEAAFLPHDVNTIVASYAPSPHEFEWVDPSDGKVYGDSADSRCGLSSNVGPLGSVAVNPDDICWWELEVTRPDESKITPSPSSPFTYIGVRLFWSEGDAPKQAIASGNGSNSDCVCLRFDGTVWGIHKGKRYHESVPGYFGPSHLILVEVDLRKGPCGTVLFAVDGKKGPPIDLPPLPEFHRWFPYVSDASNGVTVRRVRAE